MEPIEKIIKREELPEEYKKMLDFFSLTIEEMVDFGARLMIWLSEKKHKNESFLPTILFLRNMLDQADAISILLPHSSIESCFNHLRTILENAFYLEYLLEKDTYQRSMSFMVWHEMREYKKNLQYVPGSPEYKAMQANWKKDKFFKDQEMMTMSDIDKAIEQNERILSSDLYEEYKQEYDKTKQKTGRTPEWFALFDGPRSLADLAKYLGYYAFYEVLYRSWSAASHGNDISAKYTNRPDNMIGIFQIRLPTDKCKLIPQSCFLICAMVFKNIIRKELPHKLKDYEEWRNIRMEIYNAIEKVTFDFS